MVECRNCHNQVNPTRNVSWMLVGVLLIFFWPGAFLYFLTREKNICPICGILVYPRPQPTQAPVSQRPASEPRPSSLRLPQWEGKTWLKLGGFVAAVVVVILIVTTITPESDSDRAARAAEEPRPTSSLIDNELAEIANHAGRFVDWYLGEVTPLCYESYRPEDCLPAVYTVRLGGPCGAVIGNRLSGHEDLPDGSFYFIELESAWGESTGYRQIASGSRYDELYDGLSGQADLLDCWVAVGDLSSLW